MFANKFAEGYVGAWPEDGALPACRTPSPREALSPGACPVPPFPPCSDCGGYDPLASRISFFMDDGASSADDVSPALSRHSSARVAAPPPTLCPVHARRSRSFRLDSRDGPRPRLYRHGSDVGPCDRQPRRSPSRSKRRGTPERSAGGKRREHGGSTRRGSARAAVTPERGGSVRSHRGSGRRRPSSASRASAAAAAAERRSSALLPHADLPPKERRRRLVVLIVIVTFMFLVVCSVLTVVVTLTDSSFRKAPPDGLRPNVTYGGGVRKENEERMSAISRGGIYNNSAASYVPMEVSSTPDP